MDHRLNDRVLRGLERLAAVAEAGGPDEIMGYNIESMSPAQRRGWEEVERAVTWVRALRAKRDERKAK